MDQDFRLMPEQASSLAGEVDQLYAFLLFISGVITIAIAGLIIFFAIKYRRGSTVDRSVTKGHFVLMETSWIVIPFLLTMVMFFWGARLYFQQYRAPSDAIEVDGVARQWMWKFQHRQGKSETNELHVPLGQAVKVRLISEDVIHSFYVPAFRIKQDVLPGRYTQAWFRPTKEGVYHLFCAEYCGAKHSEMIGKVYVLEPQAYQAWLSGASQGLTTAEAGHELFVQLRCNSCHQGGGVNSKGPPLENLFGKEVKLTDGTSVTANEEYIRESILKPVAKVVAGYQPIMPSYDGQVGEEGILQLIAEIRSLSKADQPQAEPREPEPKTKPQEEP